MRILYFLLFVPVLTFSQAPKFQGKPLAAEEFSYDLDEQGNRNPKAKFGVVYHFDQAGHLAEHWIIFPEEKKYDSHTVHQYDGDRHVKSVEKSYNGDLRETLEHFYDANGKLVKIRQVKSRLAFSQESEVRTDDRDRIVWMKTRKLQGSEPPQVTENVFTGDTLAVSATRDHTGKTTAVWTRRLTPQGDPLHILQTDAEGKVVFESVYRDYQYDEAGNWTERKGETRFSFPGQEVTTTRSHDVRRMAYPIEHPELLTPEYLHGRWASFLHGLELVFFPNGTYLAYTWGSRKDGGSWQLDAQKGILSVTGKEHREDYVALDFRYEDGVIVLYRPREEGEAALVKITEVQPRK